MKFLNTYSLDLGNNSLLYKKLLLEEDFDFKTKNITIKISSDDTNLIIVVGANSLLELKIGSSSVMKSLEIISKTLEI